MNPLISVVIPVYNQAKELKKTLDSIFKQTYKNFEVIIIDDGSDNHVSCITNHVSIVHQENKGAPAARNRGLAQAKGEFVIFWDADVIANPEMLEKMFDVLQKNPDASFAYSNFYFGFKRFSLQHFNTTTLQHDNYIHSTSLIRKQDAILWDESLKRFQDWDYWLTMSEQGKKGIWIDEFLFRVIPGGTMSSWLPKFAYKKPWRYLPGVRGKAKGYEEAREVTAKKHLL